MVVRAISGTIGAVNCASVSKSSVFTSSISSGTMAAGYFIGLGYMTLFCIGGNELRKGELPEAGSGRFYGLGCVCGTILAGTYLLALCIVLTTKDIGAGFATMTVGVGGDCVFGNPDGNEPASVAIAMLSAASFFGGMDLMIVCGGCCWGCLAKVRGT